MTDNFLTTREIATDLGVDIHTVRNWIKKGWLDAENSLPAQRYHLPLSTWEMLNRDAHAMFPRLRKYVPREKAKVQKSNYEQPQLPFVE